ncbi:unnamed protein product [Didymodactylos carnosus]|uniref:Uncharacterized protein n=1 Tax=Didymodactylos carnosus TaxID=1234261 RepID=A0A8S2EA14_9BILA|nr:unnamed protein product [Didymodactylos carnosus]CAF3982537.1 unnamed protein product [Didymodactylos carnosus]
MHDSTDTCRLETQTTTTEPNNSTRSISTSSTTTASTSPSTNSTRNSPISTSVSFTGSSASSTTGSSTSASTSVPVVSPSGYIITLPGDPIFPICNASAGNSSQAATAATSNAPCTYFSGQGPDIAIDNITTDHYVVFGNGPNGKGGIGTGFYVSPSKGATNLTGIQFFTAALPTRDPTAITVEGSNANSSLLTQGSSWILLYSGTAGITVNTSTNSLASFVSISTSTAYTSYRVIATDQLANDSSTQYAEVYLYGY